MGTRWQTDMCRWLAYRGPEIRMSSLLHDPEHSLLDQSKHATLSSWVVNGDGVGMGWYGSDPDPGQYRETRAAWNDENVKSLARHTWSGTFLAHVRAVTRGVVSRTNTHPFLMQNWLFQHNGDIGGFDEVRRSLDDALADPWYGLRQGQTDSETMFALAMTLGLPDDPPHAIREMVRSILACRSACNVSEPFLMTILTTGGDALWGARFAVGAAAPSMYYGQGMTVRNRDGSSATFAEESTVVVSEPLDRGDHAWKEVPDGSLICVDDCGVDIEPLGV